MATPLKSIRAYCIWCCNDQPKEVRLCPSQKCPLWAYRFGKKPDKSKVKKPSPLKAIRARCLDCVGQSRKDVEKCETVCALNFYRMGVNPNIGTEKRVKAAARMRARWQEPMVQKRISETKTQRGT